MCNPFQANQWGIATEEQMLHNRWNQWEYSGAGTSQLSLGDAELREDGCARRSSAKGLSFLHRRCLCTGCQSAVSFTKHK